MPNISVQLRRGTTTEHNTFTGAEGEVTVDTDLDTLRVHDGSTAGGVRLAKHSELAGAAGNTDLGNTPAASSVDIESSTGTNTTVAGATTSLAGVMTSADKTKLDGIATGATVNSSDATLLDRANHTGTQTAATISDFDTEVANNTAVAANTAKVSNATHTGDVTGSTALTIANGAVTFNKIQQIDNLRVIGNVSGSTGNTGAVEIKNENDLGSNSATALATQASIKAYVDAQVVSVSKYDSGWFNDSGTGLSNGSAYTFSHTLGTAAVNVQVWMAKNSSGLDQTLVGAELAVSGGTNLEWGCQVKNVTSNNITVQLCADGTVEFTSTGHTSSNWGTTYTHIKVIAIG